MIDNKPSKSERPITLEDQLESLRDKKVELEKKKKVLDKQLENCRSEIKKTARLNKAIKEVEEEMDYIKGSSPLDVKFVTLFGFIALALASYGYYSSQAENKALVDELRQNNYTEKRIDQIKKDAPLPTKNIISVAAASVLLATYCLLPYKRKREMERY